jgi:hypothetical protein
MVLGTERGKIAAALLKAIQKRAQKAAGVQFI